MNHIDKLRSDFESSFNESTAQFYDPETFMSPSKQFRLDTCNAWSQDAVGEFTKVTVFEEKSNQVLFTFYAHHGQFFHGWVTADNVEYIVCSEDTFGGQTVIDLTNRKMSSYSPGEDGFIWTDFHLSPNGKTLATIGCYWGSSFFIRLFDFSSPLTLPLKQLQEIELLDNDETIISWLDNSTLKMKGIKREREPEYFEGGSMRMKILSETPVEREIKIDIK